MYIFGTYYTINELAKTAYALILTKLFYRNASLIRRPFYIRGKPLIRWGRGFRTGYRCRFEAFGNKSDRRIKLSIGENCHIGDSVHIAAANDIRIGDNCLLASHIFITDCSHGYPPESSPEMPPDSRALVSEPTFIGDNVWIGENVSILMGASVGSGSIVGANSVVTKKFPNNCILAGSPARILKQYNLDTGCWERLS